MPAGAVPFTSHRRAGAGAVVVALLLVTVAETGAAHLLASRWSARLAWTLTALSAYGVLWLVGDWRALCARPTLLRDGELLVRVGLRWRGRVPLADLTAVCPGPDPRRHRAAIRASPIGAPNLYLHLARPLELVGVAGLRRRGDCLGLRVDDPEGLAEALRRRLPPAQRGV